MRIRTLKPFAWQDEKIGSLSRDARLLFVALITLADDAGRFRAMPSVITGHAYPYDQDAPRKVTHWLRELVNVDLVRLYGPNDSYGWFPNWAKHQKISHAAASLIPEPTDSGAAPERLPNRPRALPEAI